MRLILPKNIFTRQIYDILPDDIKKNTSFSSSSLISAEINKSDEIIGLIPTIDLIKNKELFISKKYGISFEETLCNTYLYFNPNQKDIEEISLVGDVSSQEVILSKILFKEVYNMNVEIHLYTDDKIEKGKNLLVSGDLNLTQNLFLSGLSFAEEMIEIISSPYVNFVLAASQSNLLEEFHNKVGKIGTKIYNSVEQSGFGKDLEEETRNYYKQNISSFIFEFSEQDIEGIQQLIRLPYFHGVVDDIFDLKFV